MLKNFSALPSFRINLLADLLEKQIGLRYQRKFGLKTSEARIIGVIGSQGPIGFKKTCIAAGIDKSSASRQVSRLIEKGFIQKIDDTVDQRAVYLTLTARGKKLYNNLFRDATERNAQWIEKLPEERKIAFLADIEMLIASTCELLKEEEEQLAGGTVRQTESEWPDEEDEAAGEEEKRPILLNESTATQLTSLLQKLLQR